MSGKDNSEDLFDRLTGWMADVESMDLEELHSIRAMMGDDVEASEQRFMSRLNDMKADLSAFEPRGERISSLISKAREIGLDATALANQTGLSVVLVTKLDRRLLVFSTIPTKLIDALVHALKSTHAAVAEYLQQTQTLAAGAHYRADQSPRLQEQQDFFEAVRTDKSISEDRRTALLSMDVSHGN